jgi:asparagine synthase (glutamine-hydrolysing)
MCGIFTAVNTTGYFTREDFDRFVSATDLVHYRGPDASGYLALNLKEGLAGDCGHFDVFLGHRRLAIIDLSPAGTQPMQGSRRTWLTFNGEIYNYKELRRDFEAQFPFHSHTDSEVILAAYEIQGPDGFAEFNGEWAFAIADMDTRKVVLSRDRFSIKPLYQYRTRDCHYFASEIKQLLPLMDSVKPQRETMFQYLNQGLLDCDERTFIEGVRQVKPKHSITIPMGGGNADEKPYWAYAISESPSRLDDAVEQFRELLTDSVRLRLRSDVEVGALLSGGLDSSVLSLLSNGLYPGGVTTCSVVSTDPRYTETPFVDALSRHCGIRNRKMVSDQSRIVSAMQDVIWHNDGPPQAFSALAHYRMMEAVKQETNITVVLTGQGGDETLLGYRKFYFFLLKQFIRDRRYGSALASVLGSVWHRTAIWDFDLSQARRYIRRFGRGAHSFLRRTGEVAPIFECENITRRQMADIDRYSVPSLTHYEDRNAMAFGLETRLPFLDHRLVNFALSLRPEYKIRNGWSKYILREAFPELPDAIRWRRDKKGFITPEERWLRVELKMLIESMFADSVLEKLDILDASAFLAYYEDFRTGRRAIWHTDISRALMAEVWARTVFGGGREIAEQLTRSLTCATTSGVAAAAH